MLKNWREAVRPPALAETKVKPNVMLRLRCFYLWTESQVRLATTITIAAQTSSEYGEYEWYLYWPGIYVK